MVIKISYQKKRVWWNVLFSMATKIIWLWVSTLEVLTVSIMEEELPNFTISIENDLALLQASKPTNNIYILFSIWVAEFFYSCTKSWGDECTLSRRTLYHLLWENDAGY